jgi:hypothetical protein
MAFESQSKKSKTSGRRSSSAQIVVSQSYKPSTKSEELSLRVDIKLLEKIGLGIGIRADVLFDPEYNCWMVQKASRDGFTISGKVGGPTGLIRYTLKSGHARLSDDRASLPIKIDADEASIIVNTDSFMFMLESED